MPSILASLYRHNLWANLALVDACITLPGAALEAAIRGGYGPVYPTLCHIAANEEAYSATIAGKAAPAIPPPGSPGPSLAELRERFLASGERLASQAEAMDPALTLRGTWRGQPYEMPARVPLLQAINHGTEHRAQVSLALTGAGYTPPVLDVWAWSDAGMP